MVTRLTLKETLLIILLVILTISIMLNIIMIYSKDEKTRVFGATSLALNFGLIAMTSVFLIIALAQD